MRLCQHWRVYRLWNTEHLQNSTTPINKSLLFSTDYLNEQLSSSMGLLLTQGSNGYELSFNQNNDLSASLSQLNNQFVIIGQSLNIFTIKAIAQEFLGFAKVLIVSKHHLHQSFGQQAFVLSFNSSNDSPIDTQLLLKISSHFYVDCLPVSTVKINKGGLLVMDMDSTIIDMECIDEIAKIAGAGEKVSELTERAMQGELDFNQSLQSRVGCLKGLDLSVLDSLRHRLPINPGFAETMSYLTSRGWLCCIASGGFTYFADYLKDTFSLHLALSNTLGIKDGKLSGCVEGTIVNAQMKRELLIETAHRNNISIDQTVAIGDGANDLMMMDAANLGISYKAKPKVKKAADANILYSGFEGLLYALSE